MATNPSDPPLTDRPRPRRGGVMVAAGVYAAWLVFLLAIGFTQKPAERPAAHDGPSSQVSPAVPPQGS